MPNSPIQVASLSLASISIQLPFTNMLSGSIVVTITRPHIELVIRDVRSDARKANVPASHDDLADSLADAAENFFHENGEVVDLETSFNESLHLGQQDEKDSNTMADIPAEAPEGYFAAVVESLLARLKVQVELIKVSLTAPATTPALRQVRLDSEIGQVVYRTDVSEVSVDNDLLRRKTRIVEIHDIAVWSMSGDEEDLGAREAQRRARSRSSSFSASDESGATSDEAESMMRMSQAVQDLSSSKASVISRYSDAVDGSESMYESVNVAPVTSTARSEYPAPGDSDKHQVFGMQGEPIVVRATTEKVIGRCDQTSTVAAHLAVQQSPQQPSTAFPRTTSASIEIDVVDLDFFLQRGDMRDALLLIRQLSQSRAEARPAQESGDVTTSVNFPSFSISLTIERLNALIAYQASQTISDGDRALFKKTSEGFWARPSKVQPHIGHLRLSASHVKLCYSAPTDAPTTFLSDVGDLDIMEHMLSSDSSSILTLPIVIFDQGLAADDRGSGEQKTGDEAPIPALSDWIQVAKDPSKYHRKHLYSSTRFGDKAWRTRTHSRSSQLQTGKFEDNDLAQRNKLCAVTYTGTIDTHRVSWKLKTAPINIFADLSFAERLMPLLHSLAAATTNDLTLSVDLPDSLVTSIDTLRSIATQQPLPPWNGGNDDGAIEVPLLRLNVRVPGPISSGDRRDSISPLRSGILCVELKDTRADKCSPGSRESHRTTGRVQFLENHPAQLSSRGWKASVGVTDVYLQPSDSESTSRIVRIGSLERENEEETQLRPRLRWDESGHTCALPVVCATLTKSSIDTLQLMVDDATLWSTNLSKFGETSANEYDGLKILGSRFFGSRADITGLASTEASTATLDDEQHSKPSVATIEVTQVILDVWVPRTSGADLTTRVALSGQELHVLLIPQPSQHMTSIEISVVAINAEAHTTGGSEARKENLISPTLPQSLSHGVTHMLNVTLQLFADPSSSRRETRVEPLVRNFTFQISEDHSLFNDIGNFFQAPEGVFADVEPTDTTYVRVRVKDSTILLAPSAITARLAFVLGDVSFKSQLSGNSPVSAGHLVLKDVYCLAVDHWKQQSSLGTVRTRHPRESWISQGFSKLLTVGEFNSSVTTSKLTMPPIEVAVTKLRARLTCCADTFNILAPLVSAMSPATTPASQGSKTDAQSDWGDQSSTDSSSGSKNLLDSVEHDAFGPISAAESTPDMIDDDLPSRPEFFGHVPSENDTADLLESAVPEDDFFGNESLASLVSPGPGFVKDASLSETAPSPSQVVASSDVFTIRLLDPNGLRPTLRYFSRSDLSPDAKSPTEGLSQSFRLKIEDCDFELDLHAGYDWAATRQELEDEIKRVRRRLQKIKQLLDQGQTPDDSVEEATADLMESMHISLDADADASAALNALNDELEAQSETASSASTWQPLPRGQRGGSSTGTTSQGTHSRKKRSKLERSYQSQISFVFKGVTVRYIAVAPGERLASSLDVKLRSVQILDNIRTSTWHAFLTEMVTDRQRAIGNPTETSQMVHIQLLGIRSARKGEASAPEMRVRARVAPLRLHVDQDALDFLKKFFAFKLPSDNGPPPQPHASGSQETFIQYAEVMPIQLKLDYKPKRVDYNLLRQGKTIEFMNFFHFDEAEMTLRRVRLRGISGWARLFDTLNDIWTPDVKANQLADVLSGIAPVRSMVNVGAGVADLILLPIEQYQKDGRLGKGLQRGARRFAKATALEAVKLGAKLATGTQVILERAEHVLGGKIDIGPAQTSISHPPMHRTSSSASQEEDDWADEGGILSTIIERPQGVGDDDLSAQNPPALYSKYADRPDSLREALSQAYTGLSKGMSTAAQTILAVPMEVYEKDGSGGGRTVVRAVPIAVMQGARGASEAVSKTLMGLQGTLEGRDSHGSRPTSRIAGTSSPQSQSSGTSTPKVAGNVAWAEKYKKRPPPGSGLR